MTVKNNPWLYIAVRLVAITILVTPLLAVLFLTLIEVLHTMANPSGRENDDLNTMYILWGLSLGYFTWPVFLIVLLPYCLAYMKFRFSGLSIGLKLALFYSLLVLMGFIFPQASFVSLFIGERFYEVFGLYFLFTISLCPLCNIILDQATAMRSGSL